MRLGYIDYLNCYPFYYHMFEKMPVADVTVVPGYPGELNALMKTGGLDMSPISAATYGEMSSRLTLVPDFCLSSVGYVGSVVLRSNVPIEELSGKTVGITRASHTSVLLLKMLLKKYYRVDPDYVTTEPNPSLDHLDAALLIGNEAMVGSERPTFFSYDLGELWLRKTGYPVVFAVFAVQNEAANVHAKIIAHILQSYRDSLGDLQNHPQAVVAGARQKYPDIIYDLNAYYQVLKFHFTDPLKQALNFYLTSAGEMELLPKDLSLNFLEAR